MDDIEIEKVEKGNVSESEEVLMRKLMQKNSFVQIREMIRYDRTVMKPILLQLERTLPQLYNVPKVNI